jgi:DNA-binding transcriptional regulator YbjK
MSATAPSPASDTSTRRRRSSGERRLLLIQATLELIAEGGVDAVSHRAVALRADVPLGSTTYWFASRQQMLHDALEYFARTEIAALRERLAPVLGRDLSSRELVDAFTDILLPQLDESRSRTIAQYALLQEAAREPELESVCRDWTEAWEQALQPVFASLGGADSLLEARMFLAMLDGLLLGQLAAPAPDVETTVIRPALETWFERIPKKGS